MSFWLRRIIITFTFHFGHHLVFGRQIFHRIKSREMLRRSHNDLNTTEDNKGLMESFSIH
jgi:cell division protein FtsB